MPLLLLALLLLLPSQLLTAQRTKYIIDSTVYGITPADTIIAGRYMLYRKANNQLVPVHDFYPPDTSFFIRDFDYLDTKNWFVITGSRYFGNHSVLHKTTDAGVSWVVDTSYYPVSQYRSLNSMQVFDRKRLFLFDNYYMSSVYRSEDGGITWKKWVESFAQNHHGIFVCNDSSLYLWGRYGDAFSAYMFRIPVSANADSVYYVRCGNEVGCVTAPGQYGYIPEAYLTNQFNTVTCPDPQVHQYEFTGTGNWDDAANWLNHRVPPFELPAGNSITVNHIPEGVSLLNAEQSLKPGALLQINAGKQITVPAQLIIK